MTASAGAWYRVGTVNVINSQQAVTGVGTNWQNDVISIAVGDIFTLDAKTWYEVTAVNSDTSITLDRDYEGSTENAANYAIVRNTSGTILTRIAGQISVQFNQKQLFLDELRAWLNSDNASEELTDSHGVKQSLKTPAQMVRDHDDKLAKLDSIHPFPWAMRKVEFEARRAANNEKFAASGFVHLGKSYDVSDAIESIGEGLYVYKNGYVGYENSMYLGAHGDKKSGRSKKNTAHIHIAGVLTDIFELSIRNAQLSSKIKLPPAEDGTRTYDSATGVSVTHATSAIAFASETGTNKVVTDRVDMWGFEGFLREVNDADPFVYKHGLIQSLATDINGVATVNDNIRPITYFAWYTGDITSRGKGVNWQTATEAQRIAIASDPDNNIYFDDATGKFYQWCVMGRSYAGVKNGDWFRIDTTKSPFLMMTEGSGQAKYIYPKGKQDTVPTFRSGWPVYQNIPEKTGLGVFKAFASSEAAPYTQAGVGGECYFLVCGTVSRLNKGAYHPSFNPQGASTFRSSANLGHRKWDHADISGNILDTQTCFSTTLGTVGMDLNDGSIASTFSGREDGRYYDALYASGQGGVCRDMRYSAWELKAEDFAEADLRIKDGTYRGTEKPPFSVPFVVGNNSITTYISLGETKPTWWDDKVLGVGGATNLGSSDIYAIIPSTGEKLFVWLAGYTTTSGIGWYLRTVKTQFEEGTTNGDYHNFNGGEVLILQTTSDKSLSKSNVSDQYTHTDVVGDPANIYLCDDLKNGWIGGWCQDIPDGTSKDFRLTIPVQNSQSYSSPYTLDNGGSWTRSPRTIDLITNSIKSVAWVEGFVTIINYTTKAKVTSDSNNGKIFGGISGVGDLFVSSFYGEKYGRLLQYSTTGKVPTSSLANQYENLSLTRATRDTSLGKLHNLYPVNHTPMGLIAPNNNSPAFKALSYKAVENQQAFINYAYTELTYDATAGDWGDDGKVHIADNQTTMLDENGKTVLVGTARCVEPLGWIKNDK